MNGINEECAITDAFEQQIRLMFAVLLESLVQDNADVEASCRRFKRELSLARQAMEMASKIVADG